MALGGYAGQKLSKPSTESSEAMGLAAAVIILLFAFGTATAMALPIVTAVLGLVCALALIQLLGHLIDVPTVAPTLGTMIGLGVGIDYALFIVTRHKLQLQRRHGDARSRSPGPRPRPAARWSSPAAPWSSRSCSLAVAQIPLVTRLGFTRGDRRGRGRARRRSRCSRRCSAPSGRASTRCA